MPRDRRYTIQREWCGYARPQHVIRFCDAWVGSAPTLKAARGIRDGHGFARAKALAEAT